MVGVKKRLFYRSNAIKNTVRQDYSKPNQCNLFLNSTFTIITDHKYVIKLNCDFMSAAL